MNDDLDPYLAGLLRGDFRQPDDCGDDSGMTTDPRIPISQEQLAAQAGKWFAGARLQDVPAKLWLDYYVGGQQLYLRATFDRGARPISKARLAGLAVSLDELYGTEIIAVAYGEDHTWEEIEERNRALNSVE